MILKTDILGVTAIITSMVGSGVLMLPVAALNSGYALIPLVALGIGLMEYYTAHILLIHQNNNRTIKDMIKKHFESNGWVILYNIFSILAILGIIIIYVPLLFRQIAGIFPIINHYYTISNILLSFMLLILTAFLRYNRIQIKFLSVGMACIICLVFFFLWTLFSASKPQTSYLVIPAFGSGYIELMGLFIASY